MSINHSPDYGVRTFDLSEPRTNRRIPVKAQHLSVLESGDTAEIRLGDVNAPAIPTRNVESLSIPDGVENIYLTNDAGTGQLVILLGVEGVSSSVGSPEIEGTIDISDREAREIGKARMQSSGGVLIDPATEQTLSQIDGRVFDRTDATALVAEDSGLGATNAAVIELGDLRQSVNIHADTSGAATLTVEVSVDGGNSWLTFDTVEYDAATEQVEAYPHVAFADMRAHLDQNRNGVTIATKGA